MSPKPINNKDNQILASSQTDNKENVIVAMDDFFNLLLDVRDPVQIIDQSFQIKFVNTAWLNKFGYSEEESLSSCLDKYPTKGFNELEKAVLKAMMSKDQVEVGAEIVSKSGLILKTKIQIRHFLSKDSKSFFRLIYKVDEPNKSKTQSSLQLYYSISNLASHSQDMQEFFKNIYTEITQIIPTNNFYLLLNKKPILNESLFMKDEVHNKKIKIKKIASVWLSKHIFKRKECTILNKRQIKALISKNEIKTTEHIPASWMGVPLLFHSNIVGVLALCDYKEKDKFSLKELKLLEFISSQLATAIDKKKRDKFNSIQSARQTAIFESGNHFIWSVDKNMSFTTFNKAFEKSMEGQLVYDKGSNNWESKHKTIGEKRRNQFWVEKYSQVFKTGKSIQFDFKWFSYTEKDEKWREIFLSPIYYENGDIKEVSGFAHNITEQHQATVKLKESEEKFRNIFESFQDLYFKCRLNGEITMISPSVKDLVGFDVEEIFSKDIKNYYLYDPKTNKLISKLLEYKTIHNFEARIIRQDGELLDCICNIRLIREKGKPLEIEGVARDITELKKTLNELKKANELAENSLKAKENFLANMSHEIRTPMNGIVGMIDLLANSKLNSEQKEYITTVKDSSRTLLHILNDILDISKIEAGKMQLYKTPVNIFEVLKKLTALFKAQSDKKDILINVEFDEGFPEHIILDEIRFLQVLTNLCSNALKFTMEGGLIKIKLSVMERIDSKLTIKAEVVDNGIGISKQSLDKIFKTFTQADISTTKSYGGVGLGLAISKNLSELMGGTIGVASEEGVGSSFWFTFQSQETNITVKSDGEQDSFDLDKSFFETKPRILVVDDNAVNRTVSAEILKKSGCEVTLADSGQKAIDYVKSNAYDLILMDVQMPEIDGIEATKQIKKIDKVTPPIIAMTAYAMKEDEDKFLKEGFDDYLAKPVSAKNLIQKVEQYSQNEFQSKSVITSEILSPIEESEIINLEVVNQLKQFTGNNLLINIYDDFTKETQIQIENCKNSIRKNNYQEILTNLHTLKGNAGTLGITEMTSISSDIETKLKNNEDSTLVEDMHSLETAFTKFKNNYKQLINPE